MYNWFRQAIRDGKPVFFYFIFNYFMFIYIKVLEYQNLLLSLNMQTKGILIGGKALNVLGSNRLTTDTDYLINNTASTSPFIHDAENNIDYINANGNKFFAAIYKIEAGSQVASPQSILELKAYSFVQHCINHNWSKVNDAEFDMKFLVLKYNLTGIKIVNKFISAGELSEVNKVISSARKV